MAKDTPEERPNLRPRLNKALRENERLKRLLQGWLDANAIQFPKDADFAGTPGSLYAETLVATADLKQEQDS